MFGSTELEEGTEVDESDVVVDEAEALVLEATEEEASELREEAVLEEELEEVSEGREDELEERSEFAGVEQLTRNKKEKAKQNAEGRQKVFRGFFIAFYYKGSEG